MFFIQSVYFYPDFLTEEAFCLIQAYKKSDNFIVHYKIVICVKKGGTPLIY